jgi:hypothetical protein
MATPSALTDQRVGSHRIICYDRRPLAAAAKVYKGAAASVILSSTGAGYYKQSSSSGVLAGVGIFTETVDNTSGGAGALSAQINFGRERLVRLFANDDDGTPVTVAMREGLCYFLNDQTVTAATNTSRAGTVYDVTTEGVWVEVGARDNSSFDTANLSAVAPTNPSSSAANAGSASEASKRDHKHQITVATTSAEGLASAAQILKLTHLGGTPDVPLWSKDADDALAATATAEHAVYQATGNETVSKFYFVSDSAMTAADTDYFSLIVSKRDGAGGGAAAMATLTSQVASGSWSAFQKTDLGTITGGTLAAGEVVTVKITKTASGKICPAGTLYAVMAIA